MKQNALTRDDVIGVVGTLDDHLVVEIIDTGATIGELTEAWEWLSADDVMGRQLRHQLAGNVARIVEILTADEPVDER